MDEITRTIEARRWHKDDRHARMEKELLITKEMAPDMTDKARAYAEIIDSIINGYGIVGPYAIYTEDGHDYLCVSEDDCTKPCEDYVSHTDNGYLCVQLDAVNKDCGAMTSGTAGASNPVYSNKPKKSQYKVTYVKTGKSSVKKMMQEEFEDMVGYRVNDNIYDEIEYVYMNCDQFKSKQDIVDFWKEHDYNGIHELYVNCKKSKTEKSEEYLVLITFNDGSTGITPLFPDYQTADKECSDIRWNLDDVRNAEVFSLKQAVDFFGFDEDELRSLANSAS